MIVRRAKLEDLEQVIELGCKMVRASAFRHTTINYLACMNKLMTALGSRNQALFVAEHKDAIVGFLLLTMIPYWWSTKDRYVLDDGIFATRPGAGVALIREGKKWAAEKGAREVIISFNSRMNTERSVKTVVQGAGFTVRGINVSHPLGSA